MSIIRREPLRAEVRRVLLERLLSGELEPGSRINESRFASELGVSRTPLREALINLEIEGFIESVPGKGFSVAPLRAKTARELQVLVGLLEGEAMRALAELPESEMSGLLDRLRDVNREIAERASGPEPGREELEQVIELGNRWHAVLMSACDNEQLHEMLHLAKQRLYRYTYYYLQRSERVGGRLHEHEEITRALETGEIEDAIRLVQDHWMNRVGPVSEWLPEAG